jgi:tetratricopeptide (TPR) repeat protein
MSQGGPHVKAIFTAALEVPEGPERDAYLAAACGADVSLRRRVEDLLAAFAQASDILGPAGWPVTAAQAGASAAADEALLAAHEKPGHVLDRPLAHTVDSGPDPAHSQATREHTPDPATPSSTDTGTALYGPISQPGVLIAGRYTLQEKIGEGGMGEVWVAKQSEPVKRQVAIKLIKPGMDSRAVLQRFEQERQALAILDHPNIAKVLDGGVTPGGQPFFVMELVHGLPLTRFCDEATLAPKDRLELFVPICQAVQHAHQKGIVHRDLKPSNILVTLIDGRPVPKVIDFGVAKAIAGKLTEESPSTQFGAIIGTLEYMSPEQAGLSVEDIDTRADVYSLGVILYELLTGLRPIDATRLRNAALTEMVRIIREEEPSKPSTRLSMDESLPSLAARRDTEPRKLMRMLRGDLDWVVMKCLEKQRDRRYETASALARDVQRYLDGDPVEACPPSAGYRLRKFAGKHRAALATTAAFVALLATATAVSAWQAVRATRAEERTRGERDRAVKAEGKARIEADRAKTINDFLIGDLLTQAEPASNAPEDHVTLLEVLDRAAGKVGERFASHPQVEIVLRQAITGTYHGLASWEKAEQQARAWLELARRPGVEPAEIYGAQCNLAHALYHRGRVDKEVLDMAQSAVDGLTRVLGPGDPHTLVASGYLALAFTAAGRTTEAISILEATLRQTELKFGSDHPETLTVRNNLAFAYGQAGRTAEEIPLLEATLKQYESQLGRDNPETLAVRNNVAASYWHINRLDKSIPMFEELLKIQESKYGRGDLITLRFVGQLGVNYLSAGQVDKALPLLEEAYRNVNRDLTLRGFAESLLEAYLRTGDVKRSRTFLQELLAEARKMFPKDDPQLAAELAALGHALLQGNAFAEAEPLIRESLAIRTKVKPDHWTTFSTRSMLGAALLGQKKDAEAEPLLVSGYEGMRQREATIPQGNDRMTEALERLVQLYEATDKPNEAARWRKELEASKGTGKPPERKP